MAKTESTVMKVIGVVEVELHTLKCMVEQLERDAKRYRWLRKQHWYDGKLSVVEDVKSNALPGTYCPSLEILDMKIDQAMNM